MGPATKFFLACPYFVRILSVFCPYFVRIASFLGNFFGSRVMGSESLSVFCPYFVRTLSGLWLRPSIVDDFWCTLGLTIESWRFTVFR